jgi:hypothetical protein
MRLLLRLAAAAVFHLGIHLCFELAVNVSFAFRAEIRDALPLLALMVPMAMLAGCGPFSTCPTLFAASS